MLPLAPNPDPPNGQPPFFPSPSGGQAWATARCDPSVVPLSRKRLGVRPTSRPYPLQEFFLRSPALLSNLQLDCEGTPLRLSIQLNDAADRPIRGAPVGIWQPDNSGWTVDLQGDELMAMACMRSLQITDSHGWVCFDTVLPEASTPNPSNTLLQIYLHDGLQITSSSEVYLRLPPNADLACQRQPAVERRRQEPEGSKVSPVGVMALSQLQPCARTGGLQAQMHFNLAI